MAKNVYSTIARKIQLTGSGVARLSIPQKIKNRCEYFTFHLQYLIDDSNITEDTERSNRPVLIYTRLDEDELNSSLTRLEIKTSKLATVASLTIPTFLMSELNLRIGDYMQLDYTLVPKVVLTYTFLSEKEVAKLWEENNVNKLIPPKVLKKAKRIRKSFEKHSLFNPLCISGECNHKTYLKSKVKG